MVMRGSLQDTFRTPIFVVPDKSGINCPELKLISDDEKYPSEYRKYLMIFTYEECLEENCKRIKECWGGINKITGKPIENVVMGIP